MSTAALAALFRARTARRWLHLLVGQGDVFHGAAPGAELFAADVYCGLATGGALDSVAEAFAWMSREKVPVINISLVGPANALLEQIVRVVTSRGHIVVAAVGNDGPSASPLISRRLS